MLLFDRRSEYDGRRRRQVYPRSGRSSYCGRAVWGGDIDARRRQGSRDYGVQYTPMDDRRLCGLYAIDIDAHDSNRRICGIIVEGNIRHSGYGGRSFAATVDVAGEFIVTYFSCFFLSRLQSCKYSSPLRLQPE